MTMKGVRSFAVFPSGIHVRSTSLVIFSVVPMARPLRSPLVCTPDVEHAAIKARPAVSAAQPTTAISRPFQAPPGFC